ncbi:MULTISPECIES: hypothetical protein [Clostridium]|uniref:Uncharacterized protein n=1 Tax=Clostridium nitritogenes TaxID=83340 RepID=A0ABN1LRU0_9CLOT|nr:hypothetical protein [Clostridium baratii]AQM60196.1 hypothetical protein NPD11_1223 [Clostridium baratii]KJU71721.1 hypothetical protein UC77_08380 [Clostridium baratii]MBS6041561.1 hypothetical protein [Clostridium baratii]MBT9831132.1 hypothetical protein [Clostridium baratii]MDU1854978.1 hypothetical protein [Clostridium baratii]
MATYNNTTDSSFNTFNTSNNNNINPELDRYLTELELQVVNWEIVGSFLFTLSSIYYLEATLIGQEILIDRLNNIDDNLDSTDLTDAGEIFSLEGVIIFTVTAFVRAYIEKMRNTNTLLDFDEIAKSYLVTLWAVLIRIKDRAHILGRIPDF